MISARRRTHTAVAPDPYGVGEEPVGRQEHQDAPRDVTGERHHRAPELVQERLIQHVRNIRRSTAPVQS